MQYSRPRVIHIRLFQNPSQFEKKIQNICPYNPKIPSQFETACVKEFFANQNHIRTDILSYAGTILHLEQDLKMSVSTVQTRRFTKSAECSVNSGQYFPKHTFLFFGVFFLNFFTKGSENAQPYQAGHQIAAILWKIWKTNHKTDMVKR